MGAGASASSIEEVRGLDEAKQRAVSDELFDRLDKIQDGKLNLLEMKKGFAELEAQGTLIKLSASRFAKIADKDGDKMVDKDEFFAIMSKVLAKGDIVAAPAAPRAPEGAVLRTSEAPAPAATDDDADAADEIPRAHAEVPEAIPSELLLGSRADDGSRVSSLFQALDLNGDGSLSLAELTVYFEHNGALEVLGEMDPDKTGKVSRAAWDAFFAALDPLMMPVYMMSLEEVVASKNLVDAAPPPARKVVDDDDAPEPFSEGTHPP